MQLVLDRDTNCVSVFQFDISHSHRCLYADSLHFIHSESHLDVPTEMKSKGNTVVASK